MKLRGMVQILATLALALGAGWTYAQEDPPAPEDPPPEITIRLLPPGAQASEEALREITLPERIAEPIGEPGSPSAQGLDNRGRGLLRANEARLEGVANGAAAAAAAEANREAATRGQRPEDPPRGPPEGVPGPPESPPGRP